VAITLPPLRERKEDILLLAKSFAERVYSLSPQVKFSLEALELLRKYPWPGNIRELENAVVRATAVCYGTIRVKDLPERIQQYRAKLLPNSPESSEAIVAPEALTSLAVVEGRYVEKVLAHTGGNKQAAARLLEVDRKTLDRMIKRHNIPTRHAPSFPSRAA
jgi:DNA-binding NtrC family response regulator